MATILKRTTSHQINLIQQGSKMSFQWPKKGQCSQHLCIPHSLCVSGEKIFSVCDREYSCWSRYRTARAVDAYILFATLAMTVGALVVCLSPRKAPSTFFFVVMDKLLSDLSQDTLESFVLRKKCSHPHQMKRNWRQSNLSTVLLKSSRV